MKDTRFEKQTELDDLRQHIKVSEKELSELDKSVETLRNEIDELTSELKSTVVSGATISALTNNT